MSTLRKCVVVIKSGSLVVVDVVGNRPGGKAFPRMYLPTGASKARLRRLFARWPDRFLVMRVGSLSVERKREIALLVSARHANWPDRSSLDYFATSGRVL